MTTSLVEYKKALRSLEIALCEPKTDISRDATIQRFELCVELAWKTSKKIMSTSSTAPRAVIREMASQGLISNPDLWFAFLEARNLSSHTYREEIAEKVYAPAKDFYAQGIDLLAKLETL